MPVDAHEPTAARVLVVDDQEPNVRLLERLLQHAGYTNVVTTTEPEDVATLYLAQPPDLIVLDLMMPKMDGFAVMQDLAKRIPTGTYLPILVLTADSSPEARRRALSMGAKDFLTTPFDHDEALLRIRNLLETRMLHLELQRQNARLEEGVRERTQELQRMVDLLQRTAEQRRQMLARVAELHLMAASDPTQPADVPAGNGNGATDHDTAEVPR